jgi:hypothetical protein
MKKGEGINTENGANRTGHTQASLPGSRNLIAGSTAIIMAVLLLELGISEEVAD